MKTGNTSPTPPTGSTAPSPQWSPVMKTGNTASRPHPPENFSEASMEPGHEDREYVDDACHRASSEVPQWSPVMKTGNTARRNPVVSETHRGLNGARS